MNRRQFFKSVAAVAAFVGIPMNATAQSAQYEYTFDTIDHYNNWFVNWKGSQAIVSDFDVKGSVSVIVDEIDTSMFQFADRIVDLNTGVVVKDRNV